MIISTAGTAMDIKLAQNAWIQIMIVNFSSHLSVMLHDV